MLAYLIIYNFAVFLGNHCAQLVPQAVHEQREHRSVWVAAAGPEHLLVCKLRCHGVQADLVLPESDKALQGLCIAQG